MFENKCVDKTKYKIALLDVLPEKMFKLIESQAPPNCEIIPMTNRSESEMLTIARDADFILAISLPITRQIIEGAPKLRLIQKWGAGYERIDIQSAFDRGIPVAVTRSSNSATVAEYTILLILAVLKKLLIADRSVRDGKWIKMELRTQTFDLKGKVVGLVGLGNIGRALVKCLHGFGVELIYHDIYRVNPSDEKALGVRFVEFSELLETADVISIHVPLTAQTKGLFSKNEFDKMKDTSVIVNMSRGPIIDESELYQALTHNKIAGAALDVFAKEPPDPDNPLFKLDNVVLSPHMGGATYDSLLAVAKHALQNIDDFANGKSLSPNDLVSK